MSFCKTSLSELSYYMDLYTGYPNILRGYYHTQKGYYHTMALKPAFGVSFFPMALAPSQDMGHSDLRSEVQSHGLAHRGRSEKPVIRDEFLPKIQRFLPWHNMGTGCLPWFFLSNNFWIWSGWVGSSLFFAVATFSSIWKKCCFDKFGTIYPLVI